ncbi:mitochondrial Rho GTPase 1 [Echinococcus multilocularis]|uniref:Mitochondrial Rho GTPase 1 n=1 Tax=Echinococcus multilocularis TaxID=6211 RepID=A0A087W0G3_ECHMU|nr:mitochondrial Rho GTPase 1 [Echinococcus multilocularis]
MKSKGQGVVRILLVGEPFVGKTTLILSLVSEEFSPKVPARSEEITIPASVTPERVPTEIVDFSSRVQTRDQLVTEIRQASVICLVYALNDDNFVQHLTVQWLPLIRSCFTESETKVPVVLVGNKSDLVENSKMEQVLPLMERFPEIETCIECSAKSLRNLSEAFWFAQKAVLYPTAPLYHAESKELTPECVCALTRIFRICDVDNDGYLSDKELEAFQERCFAIPLTAQSLLDVKQLIRNSTPGGVTVSGVTLKGFLFLHMIFIRKGRHETTWAVLRQFGYDNHLRLSHDFLYPKLVVPSDCSTELSPAGIHFLHTIFTKYDLDGDECLSPTEVAELLATCPQGEGVRLSGSGSAGVSLEDFGLCVETNSKGWITRRGFMAHWALTALLEPSQALEYLAYLGFTYQTGACLPPDADYLPLGSTTLSPGFDSSVTNADVPQLNPCSCLGNSADSLLRGVMITSERRMDYIRGHTNRTVFYCRVYGSRKVGKTCLLQGLLGRGLRGRGGNAVGGASGRTAPWTAATGLPVCGKLRTLLLHEVSAGHAEQMTAGEALSADVACLLYDVTDADSFRYVANIFLNFYRGTRVPCLFVAGKADQIGVLQNYCLDPPEFCTKYNLANPLPFSSFDVRPRFVETSNGGSATTAAFGDGPRYRRSSADTVKARPLVAASGSAFWLPDDCQSPEAGPQRSKRNGLSPPATSTPAQQRPLTGRRGRSSTPTLLSQYTGTAAPAREVKQPEEEFHPVYVKLTTMANYPHTRRLELAQPDYAWKLTLAATILAGFGFVAFRMAKPHL